MSVISEGVVNLVQYQPIDPVPLRDAQVILEQIRGLEIDSPEMKAYAADELARIKGLAKKIEAERVAAVDPMNKEVKAINAMVRPATQCLTEAETLLKRAIIAYDTKVAAVARAEQERLDAIARAEREKLLEQAKAAAPEERPAIMAVAATVVAPIVRAAEKVDGLSTRKEWKVKGIDLVALVKAAAEDPHLVVYLEPNTKAINSVVRGMKGAHGIPGVIAEEETNLASRSA